MRGSSKATLAIAIIFCSLLCYPLAGMLSPALDLGVKINEKRRLLERPAFRVEQLAEFPSQFEAYFNENFGLRSLFIRLNNLIRLRVFRVSGSPKVLVGKEGWLYYTGHQMIDDYRGVNRFSDNDLVRWKTVLEKRQEWLAMQGVDYLFLVVPNKASIYPEYLPNGINKVYQETFLDQLVNYLMLNSKVNIVDLRKPLLDLKGRGAVYFQTDTHWTPMGAYEAYRTVVERLGETFPKMKPLSLEELDTGIETRSGGDLATMLGLQEDCEEQVPKYNLRHSRAARLDSSVSVADIRETFVMGVPGRGLPRAVMFRDSFAIGLIPYLSENFSYIKYVWKRWDEKTAIEQIILESKPDIVIEEAVERLVKDMDSIYNGSWGKQ